jgi:tRNA 2-selenouridine synthase
MPASQDTDDYLKIFLNDTPLMDVRAPVEYHKGAFPTSVNEPLLDDEQRAEVGTRYKNAGQDEAIELGLQLATPQIRAQRIANWKRFAKQHPDAYLYCFRGGLRSRTTQAWLREQGVDLPLIKGGYKAMRSFLLEQIELSAELIPLVVLSGLTGSGKTRVLAKIRNHVDLEALANHRGSAFGRDPLDHQPTQIDWENALSIELLRHRHNRPGVALTVEDEGRLIGRLLLPDSLLSAMAQAPRVFLERTDDQRVAIIREDYIEGNWPQYQAQYGSSAAGQFSVFVLDNLRRIRNRLGGERCKQVELIFKRALERLFHDADAHLFDDGIRLLLNEYYDPMYRYQLRQKPREVIFSGDENAVLQWYRHNLEDTLHEDAVPGSAR